MDELFGAGIELMFIGMGIVLVFLAMLVIAVTMMSWTISRFFPEIRTSTTAVPTKRSAQGNNEDVIAAIGTAIHRYRNDHSH